MKPETLLIHAGQEFEPQTRAIVPPPYLTSTYVQETPGVSKYEYTRTDNPSFRNLEKAITAIEKGAVDSVVYSSGTGAIDAIIHLLKSGDAILCDNNTYSGTRRIFTQCYKQFGVKINFADATHLETFAKAINKDTRLIWVETPSNPLLKINDIEKIAILAQEKKLLFCVDSTFATPLNQSPLILGASMVLQSTTKYIAGHSDVIGGAIASNSQELIDKLRWRRNALGLNPSPFDCWLVQRGLKTLAVRLERQQENAMKIAKYFKAQKYITKVIYPGRSNHPQYELAKKQMKGFGGVVSVVLDLPAEKIQSFLMNLKIWKMAESLGSIESLVDYPSMMTQSTLTKEQRTKSGIPDGLVRFSCGIESSEDLIGDIQEATKKSCQLTKYK